MTRAVQMRPHPKLGMVPTGMPLAYAILAAGNFMLESPDRATYLTRKDLFFELLQCADNDAVAGEFLAIRVQEIFDEESRLFHASKGKG